MTGIDGNTGIIAHLGYPTHSFKAPLIYNPWFEDQGVNVVVVPMGCRADDYPEFLRLVFRLSNIRGALITMPHKVTTAALVDEASPRVRVAGACNAVRLGEGGRLVGDLFDGEGFVSGLAENGRQAAGARALIVGCGGVGSAIAASLAEAGAARLGLFDVRSSVAGELAGRLKSNHPGIEIEVGSNDPAGWDIAVNATPMGMEPGDPLPMDTDRLAPETFVGEVVMSRAETAFLAAARARGCAVQIGTDMLFAQIPAYLAFFGLPVATPGQLRALAAIDR
jgi:shikimate dehydrogenase